MSVEADLAWRDDADATKADLVDGTIGEEKIIHAAGARTKTGITRTQLEKIIREAGYEPVERDTFYRPIGGREEGV